MADENTQEEPKEKKKRESKPVDQKIEEAVEKLKKLRQKKQKITRAKLLEENKIIDRAKYIIGGYYLSKDDWETLIKDFIEQKKLSREQDIEALQAAIPLLKERAENKLKQKKKNPKKEELETKELETEEPETPSDDDNKNLDLFEPDDGN